MTPDPSHSLLPRRKRVSPFGPPNKPGLPTTRFKLVWHRPAFYRYMVSELVRGRLPKVALNRYPGCVIGAAVVVGKYAYCVKWGSPGSEL